MEKVGGMIRKIGLLFWGSTLLLAMACSSGHAARQTGGGALAPASRGAVSGSVSLVGIEVASQPETRLVIRTSASAAYTTYSPQPDIFVVDLPRTEVPRNLEIPDELPAEISSISAERAVELDNELARVTVRLTHGMVARAEAEGNEVVVTFEEKVRPAVEASFVADPLPPPPPAAAELERPAPAATPARQPRIEEPLRGAPATALRSVRSEGSGESLVVHIETDGIPSYRAFTLASPLRLVVDLEGVRNRATERKLPLGDPYVKGVRVAQYQTDPAIARVVFDLDESVDYKVTKTAGGLSVSFGSGVPDIAMAAAAPQPAPAPPPVQKPAAFEPPVRTADVFDDVPVVVPRPAPTERAVIRSPGPLPPPDAQVATTPILTTPPRTPQENIFDIEPPVAAQVQMQTQTGTIIAPGAARTLSPSEPIWTGEPIDLNLRDADIRDVLRTFAQLTGLNIAIDPQVSGTVTVQFTGVPWDQAFDIILRQNGLTYIREGNVIRVGTIQRLSTETQQARELAERERENVPATTLTRRLSYARAADVAVLLREVASRRGRIAVDVRTNQLIITEIPEVLQTMANLIEAVDIPTPQVVIEARIVETTKNFSRQLGIEWGFDAALDPALGTGTGLIFPNRVLATGGPFNLGAGNPVLSLSLGNVLGTFDLDVALTAAESEGLVRIVSAPKILTQDNQPAEIQSGVQIPVQTRVNFTTTVTYIDATLRLQVTPQITAEGTVIMEINVQKVEPALGLAIVGGTNSPLLTRRAQTRLMVRDGGTTVIGGIYQATDNRSQSRVPFLHEIPILGNLFRNETIESRHDELLIFITPRIVRTV
jgi:type IV pilus secretin PilQ/predicted competence protein